MADEFWAGIGSVGSARRDQVFESVNAYLRAMIDGTPEEVERAAKEWERVAGDGK